MRRLRYGIAALLLVWPLTAAAQTREQAGQFVFGLYDAYHGKGPDYLGRQARSTFSPRLLALIRRDRARTPKGDAPSLDGDPICDCQDFGGTKIQILELTGGAGGQARAVVRLWMPEEVRNVTLDLVAIGGQWRVDDIHTADTPSLVGFLQRHYGGR